MAVGPRLVQPSDLESEAVAACSELRTRGLGEGLGLQFDLISSQDGDLVGVTEHSEPGVVRYYVTYVTYCRNLIGQEGPGQRQNIGRRMRGRLNPLSHNWPKTITCGNSYWAARHEAKV